MLALEWNLAFTTAIENVLQLFLLLFVINYIIISVG